MSGRWLRRLLLAAVATVAIAGGLVRWYANGSGVPGWTRDARPIANVTVSDGAIRKAFASHTAGLNASAYEDAFRYLLEGYLNYRSPQGAFVFYPGAHSSNGNRADGVEGFARFFPLAASWLAAGKPDSIRIRDRDVSISATLREGLLAGTRRDGPEFWGPIKSQQQLLVESSDIALGLWISRDFVWAKLRADERKQIAAWLQRALVVDTFPGNWSLFPIVVQRVLAALGEMDCCYDQYVATLYRKYKELYKGGGWFEDPPNGVDYYNVWAVQYLLFWLDQIDPKFDPKFIRDVHREFIAFYKHMVGPQGTPMMGRSICYRMATSTPLLIAQVLAPDEVSKGLAARALDATWGHFISNGSLANGTVTQGYCGTDLSVVNTYSGPASCLWGTRSLVVALYLQPTHGLLDAPREKLIVEQRDFSVRAPSIKWSVSGTKATGDVVLTQDAVPAGTVLPIQRYGIRHRALEWLTHRPRRPDNHAAMYGQHRYSSLEPVTGCTHSSD